MDERLPEAVLGGIVGSAGARLVECRSEPITGGSGAATGEISLLVGVAEVGSAQVPFRAVRKAVRPLASGRHAPYAGDLRHWAYWRREPLAYASGLLPKGPGLKAPICYGVAGDCVYLAEVTGSPESAEVAARRLGAWQAATAVPDVGWLAGHQLKQRIAVGDLDWAHLKADPRVVALWSQRDELLHELENVPRVLVHGDFSAGNLIAADEETTVALDWACLGSGPVGADVASLALSTCSSPLDAYLIGLGGTFATSDAELGYRATLALAGAGRVHWMLSQGIEPTREYTEFLVSEAP